jgi:hypothetical protein
VKRCETLLAFLKERIFASGLDTGKKQDRCPKDLNRTAPAPLAPLELANMKRCRKAFCCQGTSGPLVEDANLRSSDWIALLNELLASFSDPPLQKSGANKGATHLHNLREEGPARD